MPPTLQVGRTTLEDSQLALPTRSIARYLPNLLHPVGQIERMRKRCEGIQFHAAAPLLFDFFQIDFVATQPSNPSQLGVPMFKWHCTEHKYKIMPLLRPTPICCKSDSCFAHMRNYNPKMVYQQLSLFHPWLLSQREAWSAQGPQ